MVIGLDGGTFDLLLPLIEQGYMPNMEKLLQQGSWGRLESTVPPFTAAAWSTFATGQNPGQHGILSFQKTDRFNYHQQVLGFVDANQIHYPLWELLSEAGKKVVVVNVPVTYPPRPVNGNMITGMMTPKNAEYFTFPEELAKELGDYQIDVDFIWEGDVFRQYGLPPEELMLSEIYKVTKIRTQTCINLLQKQAWDFFMVVYTGTDRISHFFWDSLADVLLPKSAVQSEISSLQKNLLTYFSELDRGIGELVDVSGQGTHILFMSDHGFGPSPTKRFYVNIWLEQLGLLGTYKQLGIQDLSYWRMKIGRNQNLKSFLRRLLPQKTQDKLSQAMTSSNSNGDIDWSITQAYFVPVYFHVCGVELNLKGIHREGIVAFDSEYELLRDRIIDTAYQVVDPVTGEKIVTLAARREELFSGPYVTEFPDVILILNPDYIGALSLVGSQLVESHVPFRSGEHRPDGIFLAVGSNIQSQSDLPSLQLADVPATVLYLLDVPVPTLYDGRILREIIDPTYWQTHPPQSQELPPIQPTIQETPYSLDDESDLDQRLRSLGYLE